MAGACGANGAFRPTRLMPGRYGSSPRLIIPRPAFSSLTNTNGPYSNGVVARSTAPLVTKKYCNRAGTDRNVPDQRIPKILQNTCKYAQFPDALEQAKTYPLAFAWRRSGVRFPPAPPTKTDILQVKT